LRFFVQSNAYLQLFGASDVITAKLHTAQVYTERGIGGASPPEGQT